MPATAGTRSAFADPSHQLAASTSKGTISHFRPLRNATTAVVATTKQVSHSIHEPLMIIWEEH